MFGSDDNSNWYLKCCAFYIYSKKSVVTKSMSLFSMENALDILLDCSERKNKVHVQSMAYVQELTIDLVAKKLLEGVWLRFK